MSARDPSLATHGTRISKTAPGAIDGPAAAEPRCTGRDGARTRTSNEHCQWKRAAGRQGLLSRQPTLRSAPYRRDCAITDHRWWTSTACADLATDRSRRIKRFQAPDVIALLRNILYSRAGSCRGISLRPGGHVRTLGFSMAVIIHLHGSEGRVRIWAQNGRAAIQGE
jgi:hypothetical protein